jgi:disulfide bond formation protein DsbB
MLKNIIRYNLKFPQYLMLTFSSILMLMVLYFQYFQHLFPCKLCLWQRYFHIGNIFFSLLAIILLCLSNKKISYLCVFLGASSLIIGAQIAFYHVGVENHFWMSQCSMDFSPTTNTAELLKRIESAPVIPCDQVQWRFLGLSMATYNFILSLIVGTIGFTISIIKLIGKE